MAIASKFGLSGCMRKNTSLVNKIGHLVASLAVVSVAGAGIATAGSGALFTDEDAATMDVSSGWVDVAVGGPTVLALSNLKPGDVFFRSINVANTGSLAFNYALTATRPTGGGAPLVDALRVESWKTATAEACASATYTGGTQIGTDGSLSQLSLTGRQLTAGTSETVCLRISLPSSTPNAIAGKTSTVTLTVASTQL
jgi:hypothetical protein